MLPIHIAIYQRDIIEETVYLIITANPQCAKVATKSLMLIPLFYAVMRDNSSFPLVKFLCEIYPDGVKHKNKTNSLPIHFACKRRHPNYNIVKLLVTMYPGSLLCQNSYSWHPLHCLCNTTDNLKVVQLVHEACVDALKIPDRQGRTCLHLATLLVGKDHQTAVRDALMSDDDDDYDNDSQQNNEMKHFFPSSSSSSSSNNLSSTSNTTTTASSMRMLNNQMNQMSLQTNNNNNKNKNEVDGDSDDSDNDQDEDGVRRGNNNHINETQEVGQFSRKVLRYLIQQYPLSLVIANNFQATPVETVLEKSNSSSSSQNKSKNKYKHSFTWGLYDDPITARILLIYQYQYHLKHLIPRGLKLQQIKILHDLNWMNRKYPLLASYGNHVSYFLKQQGTTTTAVSANKTNNKNKLSKHKNGKSGSSSNNSNTGTIQNKLTGDKKLAQSVTDANNILFKLRLRGLLECIQIAISYI